MSIIHVISVSGGKDSAATLAIAISRFGKHRIIAVFCDTGNEHPLTYEYLCYLEDFFDISIIRLKANFDEEIAAKRMFIARDMRTGRDKSGRRIRWSNKAKRRALEFLKPTGIPFLDLCMWKGRFPSRKAQFCTQHLKRDLIVGYQVDLVDKGYVVVSWQGVRRDESHNRRNASKFERIGPGMYTYRPLVDMTADGVFAYCASVGLKPNPLYLMDMTRVGCMPCINVNKAELRAIALRFGIEIDRIAEWEWYVGMCSKRMAATFIPAPGITPDQASDHGIWKVVEWARTAHGGRQRDMFNEIEEPEACSSAYGLCE